MKALARKPQATTKEPVAPQASQVITLRSRPENVNMHIIKQQKHVLNPALRNCVASPISQSQPGPRGNGFGKGQVGSALVGFAAIAMFFDRDLLDFQFRLLPRNFDFCPCNCHVFRQGLFWTFDFPQPTDVFRLPPRARLRRQNNNKHTTTTNNKHTTTTTTNNNNKHTTRQQAQSPTQFRERAGATRPGNRQ